MAQMWYFTKKMVLCGIRSDVITGMDELKPLLLLLIAVGMVTLLKAYFFPWTILSFCGWGCYILEFDIVFR